MFETQSDITFFSITSKIESGLSFPDAEWMRPGTDSISVLEIGTEFIYFCKGDTCMYETFHEKSMQ